MKLVLRWTGHNRDALNIINYDHKKANQIDLSLKW